MTSQNAPPSRTNSYDGNHAIAALTRIRTLSSTSEASPPRPLQRVFPPISEARKLASLRETPFDIQAPHYDPLQPLGGGPENPDTVLYLAYGSNLCYETFQGRRGIRPLSQVNVVVPDLVMTFDLAGIPYVEPCFANTKYRTHRSPTSPPPSKKKETSHCPLLPVSKEHKPYHNPHWPKGLVGVVYEVTHSDYAHIIATEGGGASYHDILISCHELPAGTSTVPSNPTSPPFKAHTLFSPARDSDGDGRRYNARPDPDYAQPSARYLKLITDGADEHGIPEEYKKYLHELQPYTITTQKQRLGQWIFLNTWLPIISFVFRLTGMFAGKDGKSPKWVAALAGAIFSAVWASYDFFFKRLFGDGERTVEPEDGREGRAQGYGAVNGGAREKQEGNISHWV